MKVFPHRCHGFLDLPGGRSQTYTVGSGAVELSSTGVAVDVADGDGGGEGEVSNASLPSLLSLAEGGPDTGLSPHKLD